MNKKEQITEYCRRTLPKSPGEVGAELFGAMLAGIALGIGLAFGWWLFS